MSWAIEFDEARPSGCHHIKANQSKARGRTRCPKKYADMCRVRVSTVNDSIEKKETDMSKNTNETMTASEKQINELEELVAKLRAEMNAEKTEKKETETMPETEKIRAPKRMRKADTAAPEKPAETSDVRTYAESLRENPLVKRVYVNESTGHIKVRVPVLKDSDADARRALVKDMRARGFKLKKGTMTDFYYDEPKPVDPDYEEQKRVNRENYKKATKGMSKEKRTEYFAHAKSLPWAERCAFYAETAKAA